MPCIITACYVWLQIIHCSENPKPSIYMTCRKHWNGAANKHSSQQSATTATFCENKWWWGRYRKPNGKVGRRCLLSYYLLSVNNLSLCPTVIEICTLEHFQAHIASLEIIFPYRSTHDDTSSELRHVGSTGLHAPGAFARWAFDHRFYFAINQLDGTSTLMLCFVAKLSDAIFAVKRQRNRIENGNTVEFCVAGWLAWW